MKKRVDRNSVGKHRFETNKCTHTYGWFVAGKRVHHHHHHHRHQHHLLLLRDQGFENGEMRPLLWMIQIRFFAKMNQQRCSYLGSDPKPKTHSLKKGHLEGFFPPKLT